MHIPERTNRTLRLGLITLILCGFVGSNPIEAAVKYRFDTVTQGTYARRAAGLVIIEAKQWRITYDRLPETVTDITAVIGTSEGIPLALNETNRTWFHLPSLRRLAVDHSLFHFRDGTRAAKIRVVTVPSKPDSSRAASNGTITRIVFSYRIESWVGSEQIRGDVWGEIRVWAAAGGRLDLPWKPLDLDTRIDSVDEAFRSALAKIDGVPWQSEVDVSRRLDGGETLRQVTRRTIGDLMDISAESSIFSLPSDFRYQEPVIGAPGSSPSQ